MNKYVTNLREEIKKSGGTLKTHMWISQDFNRLKDPIINILQQASPVHDFVALDIDNTVLKFQGDVVVPEPSGMFVREIAQLNHLPVVYITAREEGPMSREFASNDLSDVGITDPLIVIFKPTHVRTWEGISHYKENARKYIEQQTNARCVMNVGDQWTDLLPMSITNLKGMRRTFQEDQYLMFNHIENGVERWSVKLSE